MTQTTRYTDAGRMFANDVAKHEMTVLHDDGVYRHLHFASTEHPSFYWFDLVTWPGNLVFRGDMGTYVFTRLHDMFEFFTDRGLDINPGYWAEKVQAGETKAWSEDRFTEHVTEAFTEFGKHSEHAAELWRAIEQDVLAYAHNEHEAMQAANDFEFMHPDRNQTLFTFGDSWEWGASCQDFKHHFLWSCFAIRHGVNRYRALQIEREDPSAVTVYPALTRPPVPRPIDPALVRAVRETAARSGLNVVTSQPKERYL